MKRYLLIAGWLGCSFVNWGFTLGSFTREFPDQNNTDAATLMAIAGPFGVPASLLLPVVVGEGIVWQLRPYTLDQRWEIFHQRYPGLSRQYFNIGRL